MHQSFNDYQETLQRKFNTIHKVAYYNNFLTTFSSQASVAVTCRGNFIAPDGWNNWYSWCHADVPSFLRYEPPWLDSKILSCCEKMISYRKSDNGETLSCDVITCLLVTKDYDDNFQVLAEIYGTIPMCFKLLGVTNDTWNINYKFINFAEIYCKLLNSKSCIWFLFEI